jgi:hypothetical protein
MNDPRQIHRSKCLELFKDRYGQRVQHYGLTAYGMPTGSSCSVDPLLPYLLNDKSFYQARLYVSETAVNFEIPKALWEAMGMSPDDYTLLVDMMSSPRSRFWTICHEEAFSNTTHPRYHKEMSLGELVAALISWPKRDQDLAHRNIVAALQTYHHYLLGHHYGKLCLELGDSSHWAILTDEL